jgi:hypothetical protein
MPLEMNPEIRAQWTDALRVGGYQQGHNALRLGNAFCCLGVLCDLAEQAGVTQAREDDAMDGYSYDGLGDLLPPSVCEWAGLSESGPTVTIENWPGREGQPTDRELIDLNDDEGWDFAQIADAIDGGAA